jgi:hypothetical protein
MTTKWEEELWGELEELSLIEQYVACGEWIHTISRSVLVELAKHRRQVVLKILELPEWDAAKLAEEVGTRRGAITRLADEGRADLRAERRKEERAAQVA